jgi:hypothetical protein
MPSTRTPRLAERESDPAGAHRELQSVAAVGQLGEERDGVPFVAAGLGVVTLGYLISEALPGIEPFHRAVLSGRAVRRVAGRAFAIWVPFR